MDSYICPVCRSPKRVRFSNYLPLKAHLGIFYAVALMSGLAFYFKGLSLAFKLSLIYLPIWAVLEFVHWRRMREASKCQICGFDPILYKKDWKTARQVVESRLEALRQQYIERHSLKRKTSQSSQSSQNNQQPSI